MLQRRSGIKEEWRRIKKPTHSPAEESRTLSITSARRKGRGFCLLTHWDVFRSYKGEELNGGLISATRSKNAWPRF